jgi:hypothetical protein
MQRCIKENADIMLRHIFISVGKMFRVVISFEKFEVRQPTKNKLHHRIIYFLLTFGTVEATPIALQGSSQTLNQVTVEI